MGITVGGSCLYFLISYFLSKKLKLWAVTLKQELKMDLLKGYFALDNCYLFRTNPGENLELLTTDSDKIFDFHANLRPSFFVACLASLFSGFLIYQQVAYLTFVFLIFAMLQVLPGYIYKKYLVRFYLDARDVESRLSRWLLTAYDAFEEIVLGRKEDYFKQKKLLDNENIKVGVAAEFAYNLEVSKSRLFSILLELVSYIILFYYLAKGNISLENLVVVIVLLRSFYANLEEVFDYNVKFTEYKVAKNLWVNTINKGNSRNDLSAPAEQEAIKSSLLQVNDLSFSYNNCSTPLLNNLNFSLEAKDAVWISGENASGKTTLLHLILGFLPLQKGAINFSGLPITSLSDVDLLNKISYLPQQDLSLDMSTVEYLEIFANGRIQEDIFSELIEEFSLLGAVKGSEEDKISELSQGMLRKLNLSITLARNSQILILDEATNHLDNDAIDVLVEFLLKDERALIIVSHDQGFVRRLAQNRGLIEVKLSN